MKISVLKWREKNKKGSDSVPIAVQFESTAKVEKEARFQAEAAINEVKAERQEAPPKPGGVGCIFFLTF